MLRRIHLFLTERTTKTQRQFEKKMRPGSPGRHRRRKIMPKEEVIRIIGDANAL